MSIALGPSVQDMKWGCVLADLIRQIVAAPDAVLVGTGGNANEEITPRTILFDVTVAEEDVGRVVGKGARTLGALTTLTHAWARKRGWRAEIVLVNAREPMPPTKDARRPFGRRYHPQEKGTPR